MSNEPKAGKGIDPELLAAYIDNRLPPDERAAVEAQLARDPDSYALLIDTIEVLEDDEIKALQVKEPVAPPIPFPVRPSKPRFRSWVIGGGVLAAAAAITLVVWTQPALVRNGPSSTELLRRVQDTVNESRNVEPRVGGFAYAPLRQTTRGAGDPVQYAELEGIIGELSAMSEASSARDTLHALGVAELQAGKYDAALRSLQRALAEEPTAAVVQSDIAATLIARGDLNRAGADFEKAAVAASEALKLTPDLPEALFNRALALQRLQSEQATAAWEQYLVVDSDARSGWAQEARRYLNSR